MTAGDWAFVGISSGAAALLVNSGVAKLVAPDPLRLAISDLVPVLEGRLPRAVVRGLAAAELLIAAGLLAPMVRGAAGIALAALGTCFAGVGVLGLLRHSSVPCGCLGGSARRPLGWVNIGLGAALALAGLLHATLTDPSSGVIDTVLVTSIAVVGMCLLLHRDLIVDLLGPARTRRPAYTGRAGSEA
jgi:hypothetical protein